MSGQPFDQAGALPSPSRRIVSLDQFRGYTVAGMLLVNYLGSFKGASAPRLLTHTHDYCSYADTIMPQFLFAVGFAFRLTFGRRAQTEGLRAAYGRMVRRIFGLMLVSVIIYVPPPWAESWEELLKLGISGTLPVVLKKTWFQTLMHIAVTSLWLLPVIRAGAGVRLGWMVLSAALHVWLSYRFNFEWAVTPPTGVDGGPLGFLTWTVPAMMGTFACDVIAGADGRPDLKRLVVWSVLLMGLGWTLSCGTRMYDVPPELVDELRDQQVAADPVFPPMERVRAHLARPWPELLAEPPFVPPPDQDHRKWNYWMMSQRGGTLSYPTFCAGFSLLVYVVFYMACDLGGRQWAFFHWFGVNALGAYILHMLVGRAVKVWVPKDAPGWYVAASLLVYFAVNYLIIRHLGRQRLFLKL